MDKFFLGDDLPKAERMARLLSRLSGKVVYIDEDFGSDREDDPWGFFVTTDEPSPRSYLYAWYKGGIRNAEI